MGSYAQGCPMCRHLLSRHRLFVRGTDEFYCFECDCIASRHTAGYPIGQTEAQEMLRCVTAKADRERAEELRAIATGRPRVSVATTGGDEDG